MVEFAEENPKWGYRQIHGLLVDDGWPVNKKRIERLWRREGLQLPPQKKKPTGGVDLGGDEFSIWRLPPRYPNHIWTVRPPVFRSRFGESIPPNERTGVSS